MIYGDDQNNDKQDEQTQNLELLPYKTNVSFKWEKLEFNNEFNFIDSLTFNLWNNNFDLQKNTHINDNLEIRYGEDCVYFKLKIEYIHGTIEQGQIERIRYFRPTSLI